MTENGKTLTYVGIALALGVVTVVARPKYEPPQVAAIVGKPVFEKFTDPTKAAGLEIVKYDESLGELTKFKVAKTSGGLWSIPSHGNYPADAEQQMKDAATSLIGLTVLGVASEDLADHEMFGVIEPNQEKLKAGDKGVGLLVSFEDNAGADLGSLIIGKEVKGNPQQRFVRVPRQDQVFVVAISPDKLSTKFEDWIEEDLLKINTFDVDRLRLKDHSVVRTQEGFAAEARAEVAVSLDANGSQWNLDEMIVYREGEPKKVGLLPGEELNKEKLDGLKNALSEVKIADVFPKPKGLDASLKTTGDFLNDREAQRSLAERGFVRAPDNEIWSANGELQVGTKDGVQYVLRFGNVAGEQADSQDGKLNRYLFVTARVDEARFPPPSLEELPPLPASASDRSAAPPKPSAEGDKPAVVERPTEPSSGNDGCETQAEEDGKKDEGQDSGQDPVPQPAAAEQPAPAALDTEEEIKRKKLEAERERITKENQRKLDKWKDDKAKAEEKVRELNARFAPWYYVISEDVYKKIHLSRSDILRESAKSAEEGTGVDAFRKLQEDGLTKEAAPADAAPPFSPAIP